MTFEERSIKLQRLFTAMAEFEAIYKVGYMRVTFRDSTANWGLLTYLPLRGGNGWGYISTITQQQNFAFTSLDNAVAFVQKLVKEAEDEKDPR